ncbi:NAD(P)H-binding protein [Oerskovia sp. M15]
MRPGRNVAVFGANGHTGRFVVAELCERGYAPLLLGRDKDKLMALTQERSGLEARQATVDDPASLDRALDGADAVINCAARSPRLPLRSSRRRCAPVSRTSMSRRRSRRTSIRSRTSRSALAPPEPS